MFLSVISSLCVLSVLLSCCVGGVHSAEHNLYPRCSDGGETAARIVTGGESAVLQAIPLSSRQMTITCLAYDVTVDATSPWPDSCQVAHQTELPYRLVLRATSSSTSSGRKTAEWDIRLLGAGSVSQVTFTTPFAEEIERYEVVLVNDAPSSCHLSGRLLVSYVAGASTTVAVAPPVVVNINPAVVYSSRRQYTYFVLQHGAASAATSATNALVRLIRANESCTTSTSTNVFLFYVDDSTVREKVLASSHSPLSADVYSVWKYYFDHSGTYQLCYTATPSDSSSTSLSLTKFATFQGNPSYYSFESGLGPRGQVYVGRAVTVKFHGSNLDTRPGGDAAKFVQESDSCETGSPAGGVRVETDLGPADDFGPNTRFTTWTWTLLDTGSFRICYRRKDHGWQEVLSRDEIASQSDLYQAGDTPLAPVPTDRITREKCPVAPADAPTVSSSKSLLRIVLKQGAVPSTFPQQVADVLCLPRAAVAVLRQSPAASGAQLWMDIDCSVGEDSLPVCDPIERRRYFLYLANVAQSPLVHTNLGIQEVSLVQTDEIFGVADPSGHRSALDRILPTKHRGWFVVGICLTLLGVAGMLVYAVIKYKENKPYFIQFGLDEDDDEGVVKMPGTSGGEGRYVPDATIEMELDDEV